MGGGSNSHNPLGLFFGPDNNKEGIRGVTSLGRGSGVIIGGSGLPAGASFAISLVRTKICILYLICFLALSHELGESLLPDSVG